jgi:hypothetical protein
MIELPQIFVCTDSIALSDGISMDTFMISRKKIIFNQIRNIKVGENDS